MKIILHCSVSEFGCASLINDWHIKRGFSKIGYHYVILNGYTYNENKYYQFLDGNIECGRDLKNSGAHVKGYNEDSIGICMIGIDNFSEKQFTSLIKILDELSKIYKLDINGMKFLYGHYELDNKKTCPNIPIEQLRKVVEYEIKKCRGLI